VDYRDKCNHSLGLMRTRLVIIWLGLPGVLTVVCGWLVLRTERERLYEQWRTHGEQAAMLGLADLKRDWALLPFRRIDAEGSSRTEGSWVFDAVPQPQGDEPAQQWWEEGDWERVLREAPGALSASGLPLGPLAALRALAAEEEVSARQERWRELVQLALNEYPSVVSPALLKQGAALLGEDGESLHRALEEWREDEVVRELLRRHFGKPISPEPGWLGDEGGRVALVVQDLDQSRRGWWLLKRREVESWVTELARGWLAGLPDFIGVSIDLRGVEIYRSSGKAESLRLLNVAEGDGLQVRWWWDPDSQSFRALLLQRLGWTASLLGLAWLGCAVAGWQTWRVIRQQEMLAERQSNFLSSVSHELRTPLASLRLMTESLLKGTVKDAKRVREYLEVIHDESVRLAGLTDNVLDASRYQRGVKHYHFEQVDPGEVVAAAVSLLELRAQRLRVGIRVETVALKPLPKGDADALKQATLNLLDNALKHSPPEREVTVRVGPWGDDGWSLEVRDQGPGLPEAERENVWQPFYRVGNELRRETQGVGLGLSLVNQIVQAHGGHAELSQGSGGGLLVRLFFANEPLCVS
jgi:signal transduction histidine kinase